MSLPRAISTLLRYYGTATDAAGLGTGVIPMLGALGITVASPVAATAIGGLVLVGVGCALYEQFVSDPRAAKAAKETREWVAETRSLLKESVERTKEQDQYHAALAEALSDRAASIGMTLEEMRKVEHPLGMLADLNDALRSEDDTRLERVLSVHDTFEAALARYIEKEFETLRSLLSLTADERLEVRSLVSRIDTRLSKMDVVLEVLAAGQTLHADLLLPLDPYDPKKPPSNPFVFSLQRVPLFGRDAERRQLHAFLNHTDPAPRWWLWHGPGGQGKTRLAHQLCLEARERGWAAGFLKRDTDLRHWQRLNLTTDTLVVLDYVSERAEDAAKLIARLQRAHAESPHRLRVLLLDRTDTGPWREIFDHCGGAQDDESALGRAMHAKPVRLNPLDDEHLRRIMAFVFHERNRTTLDASRAVELLKRIDSESRPLYAAMLADTIVNTGLEDASTLDANQLVTCVLRNEMAKWDLLGIDAAHVNALFLASILGSFDPDDDHPAIQMLRDQGILPSEGHIRPMHWSTLRAFTGAPATNDGTLPGIQPDLLAECFVVQRLLGTLVLSKTERSATIAKRSNALLDAAWEWHPERASFFSALALRDLREDAVRAGMLMRRESSPASREWWGILVVAATAFVGYGAAWLRRDATSATEELHKLTSEHPAEPALRELLAKALTNTIAHSGDNYAHADDLLCKLRELASEHSDEDTLREPLAKAIINAISHSGDDQARVDNLLTELRDLASQHPDEPAIRQELAKALFITSALFGGDDVRADDFLTELRHLASEHPDDPALREPLTLALTNAMAYSGNDHARADSFLTELRNHASEHPDEPVIRETLAKSLTNAIAHSGDDRARVDDFLTELRGLTSKHPDEPVLRKRLAEAHFNAAFHSGLDTAHTDALLSELRILASEQPHEPAIREPLAKSLTNAIAHSGDNYARADGFLTEIRCLASKHPDEPVLRERLAEALINAIAHSSDDRARTDDLLIELRGLASEHPDEPAIRQELAKALFNAVYPSGDDRARTDNLLTELRGLASQHPDEPALREPLAKALMNGIAHSGDSQARANNLLTELRSLASPHPDEPLLKERLARAVLLTLSRKAQAHPGTAPGECVALAEELASLSDAIRPFLAQHEGPKSDLSRALGTLLDCAERANDEHAARRVIAASRTLFPD